MVGAVYGAQSSPSRVDAGLAASSADGAANQRTIAILKGSVAPFNGARSAGLRRIRTKRAGARAGETVRRCGKGHKRSERGLDRSAGAADGGIQ